MGNFSKECDCNVQIILTGSLKVRTVPQVENSAAERKTQQLRSKKKTRLRRKMFIVMMA